MFLAERETCMKAQGKKDMVYLKNWENWYSWGTVCDGDGGGRETGCGM